MSKKQNKRGEKSADGRYDLEQMLKEIEKDRALAVSRKKSLSQEDIGRLVKERK